MTAAPSRRRAAQRLLASLAFVCIAPVLAEETINSSGLTTAACIQKDSDTTQFCEALAGDVLDECLAARDRMLGSCVATGEWTDSLDVDARTGAKPDATAQFAAFLLRMLMAWGDSNGDGALPADEIGALKAKVFGDIANADTAVPLYGLDRERPITE